MVGQVPFSLHAPFVVILRSGTFTTKHDPTQADALLSALCRIDQRPRAKFRAFHICGPCLSWDVADFPLEEFLPEEVFD